MDGGLAPDILASIVKKVQIRILMNLGHFIADGLWYDNTVVSYSFVGAHLDYGNLCGCNTFDVDWPSFRHTSTTGVYLSTGCVMK